MIRYIVGDIHGCYDELCLLLDKIYKDANGEPHKIIFLGDYVDRGPDSKLVIDQIIQLEKVGCVALMGNHEDMLLSGDYSYAEATLHSFGGTIPDSVLSWMQSLPKYYEDDTIIAAHAGVDPTVAMDQQTDEYLLWYRYYQNSAALLDRHFYHGHTPQLNKIESVRDRTNVDTACVYGGHLTAALVGADGKPVKFLQVAALDRIDL